MALDFSALENEVTRDADVNSSAATLIGRLADEVERLKGDPTALQALVDRMRAQNDALAAAVAAVPGDGGTGGGTPEPPPAPPTA